jgi:hypothetical protein
MNTIPKLTLVGIIATVIGIPIGFVVGEQYTRHEMQNSIDASTRQIMELGTRLTTTEQAAEKLKDDSAKKIQELETTVQQQSEAKKGDLIGVVTYFFNENYGYKPDVGAEIDIIPVDGYPGLDLKILHEFDFASLAMTGVNQNEILTTDNAITREYKTKALTVEMQQLAKYGIKTHDDWMAYCRRAEQTLQDAVTRGGTFHLTADGNGNFKRSMKRGKYYVVIQSKHRNGNNAFESLGKRFTQTVEIKVDEESDVDAKFEAY